MICLSTVETVLLVFGCASMGAIIGICIMCIIAGGKDE